MQKWGKVIPAESAVQYLEEAFFLERLGLGSRVYGSRMDCIFLYSTHEPHSSEDCQWGNLFRIMDMIDDGWGDHLFFFKDNGLALAWEPFTAQNMVLPPCSFIQWQCASRKSVLYLENFSLNHRENVWNCTNWRKQKIRRAVNKSTQKLIFRRVKAQGAFGYWALL